MTGSSCKLTKIIVVLGDDIRPYKKGPANLAGPFVVSVG